MHLIAIIEILAQVFFISHAVQHKKPRYWIVFLLIPWIGFIAYFLLEVLPGHAPNAPEASEHGDGRNPEGAAASARCLAYLSRGKPFYKSPAASVEEIQSPFGQQIVEQTIRMHQKNDWKTKRSGSHFGGSMLWGVDQVHADAIRVHLTSAAINPAAGTLYYVLDSDGTGGLFAQDLRTKEEKRLFHREHFRAKELDFNPEADQLVCARLLPNGTSNLMVMNSDGSDQREVTEGDSIDEAPSWMPGKERRIIFQSSGVARNGAGVAIGRGPASIQALDLDNNRMTTVLEDSRFDFLQPHLSADGYLYYIRRPYELHPINPLAAVLDIILFPFRLVRALFDYLNFFSLVYSKKPLTTAAGPKIEGDDMKTIALKGRIFDAQKAIRTGTRILGVPSLVPASWELVRRATDRSETVVARHVAAFDIGCDGAVVYSNGFGVFQLDHRNRCILLLKDRLIEDVVS